MLKTDLGIGKENSGDEFKKNNDGTVLKTVKTYMFHVEQFDFRRRFHVERKPQKTH